MTETKKKGRDATGAAQGIFSSNHCKGIGWRGGLALGNGQFRINGTYDLPASLRRARRLLARELLKAERRARREGGRDA